MKQSLVLDKSEIEAINMILNETDVEEGDTLHLSDRNITLVNKAGTTIITAHRSTLIEIGKHPWKVVKP